MIPARHTWFHLRFFRLYTSRRIRRNFSEVIVHGEVPDVSGKPLLVVGNHFSWWDGFFILWLNARYFHKKFHVMMLEDQLRRNMILNKTGAFSIQPGSRKALESLAYANTILKTGCLASGDKNSQQPLVLMYPQGRIQSMHSHEARFEKGIELIARDLENRIHILFVIALVDYFSNQKPQLHFYMQGYPFDRPLDAADLEKSYNRFLDECIKNQTSIPQH
jgi:1-acyl-sn-glycerol-3-phosphate acyltransferase